MSCGAPGEVRVNGLRLRTHAWPSPGWPRALLLHSLAAHGHWWDWAAPPLAERFDVLALDFRAPGIWTYAFDHAVFLHPPVDPWPFLPRIGCPALVVHGEASTIMDAETCGRVAAAIPHGRAVTLPGAHHHLIIEEPERFSRIVADWHRAIIGA